MHWEVTVIQQKYITKNEWQKKEPQMLISHARNTEKLPIKNKYYI